MKYKFEDIIFNITEKKKPVEEDKYNYIGLEHLESGNLFISKWGSDTAPEGEKIVMKKGDVLFGKRRAYQKKVAISPIDGIFSAHGMVLRPKEDVICKEFLPFFISSEAFLNEAIRISVGGLSPTVNWKDIRELEFDLPSLAEQKVLAEKLWAAYEVKQSYLKMIAATEEMIEASYKKMIETSDRKNCLGDYIVRMSAQKCGNRELPVLSITKDKGIVFQSERFESVVVSVDKSGYIIAPKGCLVQGIHIDECNFGIQKIVEEGIVSPAYKLWSFKGDDFIPELIEYYLRSPMAIKYFQMKFLGATVRRRQVISKDDFLSMPLNLPSFDGQKTYYDFFVKANKSISELRKSVDAIDKVIKSLINENL
jgi:type I restriction enzyme S subunit